MINGLWFQQLLEIALIFRTIKTRDVDFSLKFPVIQETNYGLAHIFAALCIILPHWKISLIKNWEMLGTEVLKEWQL